MLNKLVELFNIVCVVTLFFLFSHAHSCWDFCFQDTTKNFEAVKERMEDHNRILDVAVDDNTDKVSNVTNSIKTSTGTCKYAITNFILSFLTK